MARLCSNIILVEVMTLMTKVVTAVVGMNEVRSGWRMESRWCQIIKFFRGSNLVFLAAAKNWITMMSQSHKVFMDFTFMILRLNKRKKKKKKGTAEGGERSSSYIIFVKTKI